MDIAVTTRLYIPDQLDGIGTFTKEVFDYLPQAHPEHTFHFLFDRPISNKIKFSENVIPHVIGPPTRHIWLTNFWYNISLRFLLKKIKPDLFISADGLIPSFLKTPSIAVIHDLGYEVRPQDLPDSLRKFYQTKFSYAALKATRVATVSENSKRDLSNYYGVPSEKIDVVYNGINHFFKPISEEQKTTVKNRFSEGKDYFVFVGTMHPRKNLLNLLRAFEKFKNTSKSEAKLLLVGKKWIWEKELKDCFESMNFKNDVVLPGRLSDEDLSQVYAASIALTYVPFYEGFGIPIVEAFESETCVITSNVSSMPEVAGDAAILIDPNKPDQIADAMNRLATDEQVRQDLIERGRLQKLKFSWQQTADALWQSVKKIDRNA